MRIRCQLSKNLGAHKNCPLNWVHSGGLFDLQFHLMVLILQQWEMALNDFQLHKSFK